MDRQRKKKIQNIRIIMTNIFMGVSVIAIVFILMLIAMGFSFNENGDLEQSGLVQISSNPKGATVEIDKETQFSKTDFNKMLHAGSHHVKITKTGYDVWEKRINVDAGLLTRIEWARLFPTKTSSEKVLTFSNIRLAEYSADHKHLALIEHNSHILFYIDLQGERISQHKLSLRDIVDSSKQDITQGEIKIVSWNENCNRALLTWTDNNKTTWYLVDLQDAKNSVNLTQNYGHNFTDVKIANSSASKLWAVENGKMRLLNVNDLTASSVLFSNVEQFVNHKDTVAYISKDDDDHNYRKIYIYKDGEKGSTIIRNLKNSTATVTLAIGSYWNENWLAYSVGKNVSIISGIFPSHDKANSKNSFKEFANRKLDYTPNLVNTNAYGRIVIFTGDSHLTSIDVETHTNYDATTETEISELHWLDNYLIWENNQQSIVIRDFDGDNRREILSTNNDQPINITADNKWLYYFNIDEDITEDTTSTTVYHFNRQKLQ